MKGEWEGYIYIVRPKALFKSEIVFTTKVFLVRIWSDTTETNAINIPAKMHTYASAKDTYAG